MNKGAMKVAFVMGDPVAHSLSPKLHHYWINKLNINAAYVPFHVLPEALPSALEAVKTLHLAGGNLTLPHKEHAIILLDEVSEEAQRIGAVNTIIRKQNNQLYGTNTDGYGFIENLKAGVEDLSAYLDHALILGAGGAARSICVALQQAGCQKITITNRTKERAEALAMSLGAPCEAVEWSEQENILSQVRLLVNTTSLGMAGKPELDISLLKLPTTSLVTDIVYTPLMTGLLKRAQAQGNPIVTGLGMLVYQAIPGFEAWFGCAPPKPDAALYDYLSGKD